MVEFFFNLIIHMTCLNNYMATWLKYTWIIIRISANLSNRGILALIPYVNVRHQGTQIHLGLEL